MSRLYLLMEICVFVKVERLSIQQDLTLLGLIQPLQEADTGGLSTAGGTDQRRHLPWLQLHRH